MLRLTVLVAVAAVLPLRNAFGTTAADIPCQSSSPPPNPCVLNTAVTVTTGSVIDFGTRGFTVKSAGSLDAKGGTMKILASSVTLQPGSLLASAAGSIEVDTTGPILMQAASSKSKVDVSGNFGGSVLFVAGGDLTIAGQILADAVLTTADGGSIDITGTTATITSVAKLSAMGGGAGTGGDITVASTVGDVTINGTLDSSSSLDGGTIEIDANNTVTTTSTAVLNSKGGAGGVGDTIDLTAFNGNGVLAGTINGSASGDTINGGGSGADFSIDTNGPITCSATIDVSGGGIDGTAGTADFSTFDAITLTGSIDAAAPGSQGYGGVVSFETTQGLIDLRANIDATGPGFGGDISAFSFLDVRVSAKLTSDGPNAGVELTGCNVNVTSTAKLSALGSNTCLLSPSGTGVCQCATDADCGKCSLSPAKPCTVATQATDCGTGQTCIPGTCSGFRCTAGPRILCRDSAADCAGSGQNTIQESSTLPTGSRIDGPLVASAANRIEFRTSPPVITSVPSPAPTLVPNMGLFPCGGPPPTTTTTSTTTTTLVTTTSTTTTVPTTTTTTITIGTTTTTTAPPPTTTTIIVPTTTTTTVAVTTTTAGATTTTTGSTSTTVASTTTTSSPPSTTTTTVTTSTTTTVTTSTATTVTTSTTTTVTTSSTTSASSSSTTTTTGSTSTSVPQTSTTTTTTTASTTTTTTPTVCNPPDCDDGDACTDDHCDPSSGCVHVARTGFDAVTCELDAISSTLVTGPIDKVGGPTLQARLLKKIDRAHKHTDAARLLTGRRLEGKVHRIEAMVTSFARSVMRAQARGKVDPDLAGHLLDLAQRAEAALRAISP